MNPEIDARVQRLRRILLPLVVLPVAATVLTTVPRHFQTPLYETLEHLGLFILLVAGLGRIWCSLYQASQTPGELCTTGPYSICRNPKRFFTLLGVIGVLLALQNILLLVVATVLMLLYYRLITKLEEIGMARRYGEAFTQYRRRVPRFFPQISCYRSPQTELRIAPSMLERSLLDVSWFFAAVLLIDAVEAMHRNGIMVLAILPF